MKLAIVGAGVAGSYLGNRLQEEGHQIQVFEESKKDVHWPVCAWGASKNMLEIFSKNAGLDFENYILHRGKKLRMDLPANNTEYLELKGLVTYDKYRWEQDLCKNLNIKYGVHCTTESEFLKDYDYVVDCTGLHRSLLPRSQEDFIIPSYEYLVDNVDGIEEFYVIGYKGARGYFWFFPLGNGRAYIGAGDIDRRYFGISEFFEKNPQAKVVKKIGRPIRLSPPKRMLPFSYTNKIGVGESIGCVFPMLGEGIIPSLLCCDIFIEVLNKDPRFDAKLYEKRVLKKFGYYDDVYRIVRMKMDGKLSTIKHFKLLMSMYRNMKRDEKRFGFGIDFEQMNRLLKAL
ncbi:MAG TPA: NAD(P)/FAD-dependent oxidoreductase [Nitrososphaeraceae archaeon]